jgi:hypothetical protein
MKLPSLIDEAQWQLRNNAMRLWLVVKHRPLVKCPFCKGKGGEVSGYYEPEWCECHACYDHWEQLTDHGLRWFEGRLPVWEYLRARASIRFGLWYPARFRDLIRCKMGRHRWVDEVDHSMQICCVCYEHRDIPPAAACPTE